MMDCYVCGALLAAPIYHSSNRSMSSMLEIYDAPTTVYYCDACGHLQTTPIVPVDDYYAKQYKLLVDAADDDLLYAIVDGRKIYHSEHRVNTLLGKLSLPTGAKVLDFGCAKGAALQALCNLRNDITPYYFDVTDRYVNYWRESATPSQWAIGTPSDSWSGQMDLVCSFYVLEHVVDPVATVRQMASLLKPNGTLYFVVPSVQSNPADMVVADHLQHFSPASIRSVLERSELEAVEIDDQSHDSAFLVIARHGSRFKPSIGQPLPASKADYVRIAHWWTGLSNRIRSFEASVPRQHEACIYGAGFYGNFIASCLEKPESVSCFVDQNAHLRGRPMRGKSILDPADVSESIDVLYVGLKPQIAKKAISSIACWKDRRWQSFYL